MLAGAELDERSKLFDRSSILQKISAVASLLTTFIALILIVTWMNGTDLSAAYLGGLDFQELIFNYHPIFMTLGMLFCGLSAIFSYRVIDLPKTVTKSVHAFLHMCAVIFVSVGLWCVFLGNNDKDHNTAGMYFANLYSMHSFIGLAAVIVYFSNFVLGFVYFLSGALSPESRAWYLPSHSFLGVFSVLLVFMAIETGIMDLTRELGCDIAVDEPDTNPAENYHKLKEGCRVGNAAGIFVLLTALLAFFALYDFQTKARTKGEGDPLLGKSEA